MKIAFIVDQFPSVSQTFVLRQITGLLDRGHEVEIFAHSAGEDPVTHGEIDKYGLLERTCYLNAYASSPFGIVRLVKRIALLIINFHKNPAAVARSLNVVTFGKRALLLQLLWQIVPFLGKGPYDIVHCQFGYLGQAGLLLRDLGVCRGKVVTSFRGHDISSYTRSHGADTYADLWRRGDLFLCVSAYIKNKLISLGCDEGKVVVHRSGAEVNKVPLRSPNGRNDGKTRILTIARLVEKKGVEYGIQAVARVVQKEPQVEYSIAGDGPLKDALQNLIRKLKLGNHVRILGWKSQEEIAELLRSADMLVAPSVTGEGGDEEGVPGVIMEAFAVGLPVISTYHAGIPEVIQDNESGFLVPERDVDALARKIHCLVAQPELRLSMGQKGRQFVEEHYDIDKLNDRLVELYERVITGDASAKTGKLSVFPVSPLA